MKLLAMMRFTLFEAVRKGTLIFYAIIGSLIIILFAIGLKSSPGDPGTILLFGTAIPTNFRGAPTIDVLFLMLFSQSSLWIIILGTTGVAGLMTSFLEKGTIELYLSKPIERWELFLSRAFGASIGVAANVLYCIGGIWLVFGLKVGIWHFGLLSAALLVSYAFICYYSIVSLIGIVTKSGTLSIVFGLIFMFVSSGLEHRTTGLFSIWNNQLYHKTLDVVYYLTPQLDGMLRNAASLIGQSPRANEPNVFSVLPFVFSTATATLYYALSALYFSKHDF